MTYVRGNTRMQRVGSGQAAPQNHLRNATVTLTATGTDASQRSRDPTLTRDKLHVH